MKQLFSLLLPVIALTGCLSTGQLEPVNHEPDAIVQFQPNHSYFNNVEGLKLTTQGQQALIVFNATKESVSVAKSRASRIVELMSPYSDIYVAYRFTVHKEDAHFAEVFLINENESVRKLLSLVGGKTLDSALGRYYSEDKVRLLERNVSRERHTVAFAISLDEQLKKLVSDFGWVLSGKPDLISDCDEKIVPKSFEFEFVAGDSSQLTDEEITDVLNIWFQMYPEVNQNYKIATDAVNKGLVIYR